VIPAPLVKPVRRKARVKLAAPQESANTTPETDRRTFRAAAMLASPAEVPAMA
jgi:hypothetical protein